MGIRERAERVPSRGATLVAGATRVAPVFGEWPRWETWIGGAVILASVGHESYRQSIDADPSRTEESAAAAPRDNSSKGPSQP